MITKVKNRLWNGIKNNQNELILIIASFVYGITLLTLAYGGYNNMTFLSYLLHPTIILLNILPILIGTLIIYNLCRKLLFSFLSVGIVCYIFSLINYFKLIFRDDPFIFEDMILWREAGKFSNSYKLFVNFNVIIPFIILIGISILCKKFHKNHSKKNYFRRMIKIFILVLVSITLKSIYFNDTIYSSIENYQYLNRWSGTQYFIARGFIYPFLHSISNSKETPPAGYDEKTVLERLENYTLEDINLKVNIIAVMREAYADFSKYEIEGLDNSCYDLYHQLRDESIHGDLIVNAFGGGTIDTERGFLTGSIKLKDFRTYTNSYVWYFRQQGYTTQGIHPFYKWMYNRENVNEYLGFETYRFYENDFENMTDAYYPSDKLFYNEIWRDYIANRESGKPFFSYNLNVQSHGPYNIENYIGNYLWFDGNYSQECKNSMNNYLNSIHDSDEQLLNFVKRLREAEEPIILVTFGDHLPWQGDGNIFYKEMGLDFSLDSDELIRKQYTEEYLIWANDAAKKLLNNDFLGEGPTISPCYLMNYLFEECGWQGNEYMQKMTYEMKRFPVISSSYLNIYKIDDEFVHDIPENYIDEFNEIMNIQYYWRNHFLYKDIKDDTENIENEDSTTYSQNYIGEIKIKVDNVDNDEITFVNNTDSSQSLLYAWYVNEKKGEDYENIYQQWYTNENIFKYQFSQDKEYSIIAFIKGSENEDLFKYKEVAIINYDHKKKEWVIKLYEK